MKVKVFLSLFFLTLIAGCGGSDNENQIKVGTIDGPETVLMDVAKEVAKQESDLDVKIVTFNDYAIPNEALNDGSIDANVFQHAPYLAQSIAARGYKLVAIGKTFIYPMGLYSKKLSSLNAIKQGSVVAVPSDPTNEARALLLLQRAGLLTLKAGVGDRATVMDIIDNPYQLKIKPLGAAQLPRVLPDVALAAINMNYAIPAGLVPKDDALFLEDKDSEYANLIVVCEQDKDDPRLQALVSALHSQAEIDAANEIFKGQAIPAF